MEEDEELFREMNEEDDLYMGGDDDYYDPDDDNPDYNEVHHSNRGATQRSQSGMGCLLMLPLLAGTLTFVLLLIL